MCYFNVPEQTEMELRKWGNMVLLTLPKWSQGPYPN